MRNARWTSGGRTATDRRAFAVFWPLAAIGCLLAGLSLVLLRIIPWDLLRDPSSPVVQLLDVRAEGSLHTWFNGALLTVGAALHAGVAVLAHRAGRAAWPWLLTAGSLVLLSVDDLLALHEQLEPLGRALGAGEGGLHFAWVLPGLVLAAGLAAVTVVAARRLPPSSRRWMLLGVAALLAAAVGLESAGGLVLDSVGDGALYVLVSHAEELIETCAAAALLCAGVAGVRLRSGPAVDGLQVGYVPGPEQICTEQSRTER
ncbi:hypothetical protein O2V63_12795 [Modestobacter sp. VKM Ac-2977]|uniref:hypothetical protein n=1 Tax=Modestobacter sp. VKM Ac-2977 TaxID=3004131 RepID=UPI0022AA0FB8|nr:hypothetical protein [Modestobacter sp. VKM Ac-2977]MCZ2821214.1 hypothetical protein [Modestobacter sp. VKM Ac-2977]